MLFGLTNPEVAIFMMGIFLFAVLLGFPIAFTLMAMGIGFGYYAYYDATMMEHQLMDDNKNIVHCVIAVSDQKTAIEFQKSMAPKRRQVDSIRWKIKELEADKILAKLEQDEQNVVYIRKCIAKQHKKTNEIERKNVQATKSLP